MSVYSILQSTRLAWIMEGTFPQCKMADNLLLHNGNKVLLQIGLPLSKIEKELLLASFPWALCFWTPLGSSSPFLLRINALVDHLIGKCKTLEPGECVSCTLCVTLFQSLSLNSLPFVVQIVIRMSHVGVFWELNGTNRWNILSIVCLHSTLCWYIILNI